MFFSGLGSWGVGLVTPALDLSFGSWACGPASFLNGNYVCSWTWKQGRWTCHLSIGLVFWKLGLQPSFILNKKLFLFLDLEAGTLNLSLQHWTCLLEARPAAPHHSQIIFQAQSVGRPFLNLKLAKRDASTKCR